MSPEPRVLSVNVGVQRPIAAKSGTTGIDKRPVNGPVLVMRPGGGHGAGSGLAGDHISDERHHGGDDQAVYAYAREDLDGWADVLGREFTPGSFGENLTTVGVDVTGSIIGERWQVGGSLILVVTCPRVPCRTFTVWLGEDGWERRFVERGVPGAYLRVVQPGPVRAGDPVVVTDRPAHGVTVGEAFAAITTRPDLLPRLATAEGYPADDLAKVRRRVSASEDHAVGAGGGGQDRTPGVRT